MKNDKGLLNEFAGAVKENKGVSQAYWTYAAQKALQFDAEIAEKDHLWMETVIFLDRKRPLGYKNRLNSFLLKLSGIYIEDASGISYRR